MDNPRNSAQIRQNNIRTLLDRIRRYGPISKRDLQALTGLSWGAVSSLTTLLHENGYISFIGKQTTNVGRRPTELDINGNDHYIVGVDLNTSGICAVVTDMKGRIKVERQRLLAYNTYDCVMDTLLSLLDELLYKLYPNKHILGIGLAVQGFVDTEKGISKYIPHVKNWKDVPVKQILEERYGYPTLLMHDPDCIMVAEKELGETGMHISKNAILLRIDGGIGMSMLFNGQLYLGATGQSGEIGHVSVNPNGPICSCGSRGCLEEYSSGNGLVRRFVERVNNGEESGVDSTFISERGYRALGEAALHGDELCIDLFRQMGEHLGLALSGVFNMLNPELVVIYGGMSVYRSLFSDAIKKRLAEHVYTGVPVRLDFSKMGTDAPAQGVALVVAERCIEGLEIPSNVEESVEPISC